MSDFKQVLIGGVVLLVLYFGLLGIAFNDTMERTNETRYNDPVLKILYKK